MSSLISNFEYDIFISYRNNDNRSGWVTEFVKALEEELAGTIKEPLSVYFDVNPHDGLLETHNVDKSLEGKLKCLIFIPIISQTYCDPKSFAWQHEFIAFNKLAKDDQFGRDIKLSNGNVASRILPVKIHELDADDKMIIENEIGGVLRAIEFIYKEAGVNRPLKFTDSKNENLSKTDYRNQINKIANGIKEIITALKNPAVPSVRTTNLPPKAKTNNKKSLLAILALIALVTVVGYFTYPTLFLSNKDSESTDKSIAVLPFVNMSNDPEQVYFSDGMMEEILNQLVKIHDLRVTSRTSSVLYRDSKLPLKTIASELGVAHILEGSVRRSGQQVRITVQLIEAGTDQHLWSETFDRDLSDIFSIQTEISKNIASQLKTVLTATERKQLEAIPTTSSEAYDYYLKAKLSYAKAAPPRETVELYNKAISLDPEFSLAYFECASTFSLWYFNKNNGWQGKDKMANTYLKKAELLNPEAPEVKMVKARILSRVERKYDEAISFLEQVKRDYPNNAEARSNLSAVQRRKGLFRDAVRSGEEALQLDPNNSPSMYEIARTYAAIGEYEKAVNYVNKSISLLPDNLLSPGLKFLIIIEWKGNVDEAVRSLDGFTHPSLERLTHYLKRDFDAVIEDISKSPDEVLESPASFSPRSLQYAQAYYQKGDILTSKKYADSAMSILKREQLSSPADYRIHMALGFAYAYAGNFNQAMIDGKKASELMPISLDAFVDGPVTEANLMRLYILTGQYDMAMDKMEYLLTIPGLNYVRTPRLRIDPFYDKLRTLPRFQKILATEYKIKY